MGLLIEMHSYLFFIWESEVHVCMLKSCKLSIGPIDFKFRVDAWIKILGIYMESDYVFKWSIT